MYYPKELSVQARARLEAERLRAGRDLEECVVQLRAQTRPRPSFRISDRIWTDAEKALHHYILRVFSAFAREACDLGKQGVWPVDRIRSEADEFLRRFTIDAECERGRDRSGRKFPRMISNWDGSLLPEVELEFHNSDEWRQYEAELLAVAEQQACPAVNEAKGQRTKRRAEIDAKGQSTKRRAEIDAFLRKCKQETSLKATRTHIWRAAGHSWPRQFAFWQSSDPKATEQDDQNFRRILAMSPTEFVALLKRMGII